MSAGLLVIGNRAFAAEGAGDLPTPNPEITKIPITIYPNNVLVVRGRMVAPDALVAYLAAMVPDAKKPLVEVTIYPNSKKEVPQVGEIVRLAKEAGYDKVAYESPKEEAPVITEITILISRTGAISVDGAGVKDSELKAHLEKKVEAERRPKVTVYVRFTRMVPMKKVGEVAKTCRDAGFTDVVAGLIAE